MERADSTGFAYGMLNWGDYADMAYTRQGRGDGTPIWLNNEYDVPHSFMLMHARTGERRYLDKALVAAAHWMDVDICHSSDDPYRAGAQLAHAAHHVTDFVSPCHEWVEGLLDYYHQTGDERGLKCAKGIGDNVVMFLQTPHYGQKGGINARETGWALRAVTALYKETNDEKWLAECERIVAHFADWKKESGAWLSPYTVHTEVRVPFMISIAVCSLMRYYRVRPSDGLKNLIVGAVDDLIENAKTKCGLFYYKELPSLRQATAGTQTLEALAYAFELTRDRKYISAGIESFKKELAPVIGEGESEGSIYDKKKIGDAVVSGGASPKTFSFSHIPTAVYYKALVECGMAAEIKS